MLAPDALKRLNLAQAMYEAYRDRTNRTKNQALVEWRWMDADEQRIWEHVAESALKHLG